MSAIRDARVAKGWTQSDLAVAVGVSARSVSKWETGRTRPRGSTLLRLSAALGVPVERLAD